MTVAGRIITPEEVGKMMREAERALAREGLMQPFHELKIMIIGSTQYRQKMQVHKEQIEGYGHTVKMPLFDSDVRKEIDIATENKERIKWADEVHLFWDGRSQGTLWDVAVAFALDKPIRIIFLNHLSLRNCILQIAGER